MFSTIRSAALFACFLMLLAPAAHAQNTGEAYVFENLGRPMEGETLGIEFVTPDRAALAGQVGEEGGHIAWAKYLGPELRMMVGVHTRTGEVTKIDLVPFGQSNLEVAYNGEGQIYLHSGRPGHFLSYDIASDTLTDLGAPVPESRYWLHGHAIDEQGRFFVGSYPGTHLAVYDPATGEVRNLGKMAEDPKQKYIIGVIAGPDGIIYCPVGLHHKELWAYDTRTETKKQILPEELTTGSGRPNIWKAADGQVYGKVGDTEFRCTADGIEILDEAPPKVESDAHRWVGDERAVQINGEGDLVLADRESDETRIVSTEFEGAAIKIYAIGDERDGVLYGGGFSPARTWSYDRATGETEDLGVITGGGVQVYDVLSHERGLFLSSYTGAVLDFYDPTKPIEKGKNPIQIAKLSSRHDQERAHHLTLGPDGMIYTGTTPIKGHLGGALVRIDPETREYKVWRNIVPEQSYIHQIALPETGEILVATTIDGGTSAIPTQKEAVLFFWDVEQEKITGTMKPIPGTRSYRKLAQARNGLVYGIAHGDEYFAIDPKSREVVYRGTLPCRPRGGGPGLLNQPVGERGLLYGLGNEGELFVIDPQTHEARIVAKDESLGWASHAHAATITEDGTLYYGYHADLMRCRLPGSGSAD